MDFTCPLRVLMHLPVLKSHTLPIASNPQDKARDPSHWKLSEYTSLLWPSCSSKLTPVFTSHSLHVLSKDAVPTHVPEGWKLILASLSVCPSSVCRSLPDLDQSLAVESQHAVATCRTSPSSAGAEDEVAPHAEGCHAMPVILSSCARTVETLEQPSVFQTLYVPLQLAVHSNCPSEVTPQSDSGLSSPNSLQSSLTSFASERRREDDFSIAPFSSFSLRILFAAFWRESFATFLRYESSSGVPSV
mmetsp:Transcript_7002/g.12852  ORF Transcript_7002/g.12852 Transcript_7002/m.12852 type:complete len:246 (-) Transcript_7002:349-1086(-)|eukprot:CAMPEP_0197476296 /NCGR_PEP_ID=MMETSP1309-20131121/7613_1 /TAXON_ID=464262 /ORGANISM="Genus nov. species nov., Strain RCC998" /LENGTH=245 /DNA_ID=CAMNT_0043016519 /DNA_START=454 /DNA_END=1191 /DNA_ORIENTATION=-